MTDHHINPIQTIERDADLDAPAVGAEGAAPLAEAIAVIDTALAQMMQRELVASGEVADLLLDLRTLLTAAS